MVLLRLSAFCENADLADRAATIFRLYADLIQKTPSSCCQMLCAVDFYLERPIEVALVGSPVACQALLGALNARFLPNKVVVGADPAEPAERYENLPLLVGKLNNTDSGCSAYVCRDSVCSAPVTEVADFGQLLDSELGDRPADGCG